MTSDQAKRILARLKVHFPTFLPADARLAQAAAEDWLRVMADCPPEIGARAADLLVTSWHAKDGAPKIADWFDVVRPMLARAMVGPVLEVGEEPQSARDRRLEHVREIKEQMGWTA